jgi:hypothetical protein
MGNYRTTPPSNLPPGIVAYLLDGQATGKSALASLFYLADLGLIRLNLGEQLMLERLREGDVAANQAVTTPTGETVKVPDHAAMLFNKLLPDLPMGETRPFTAVQDTFHQAMPPMYTAMAQEMVTYFYGRKGKRLASGNALNILPIAAFLLFVALAAFVLPNTQATVPLLFCGFFVTMVGIMVFIARSTKPFSNLTALGKLESKRWQGFKTYLQDIQKYGDLAEAQEILDRYFAYAIALGVDESLLAQVGDWGGYAPVWVGNGRLADGTTWHNRPYDRRYHHRAWYQRGSWLPRQPQPATQSKTAADQARPSLQTISNHLTRSLNETSSKMTTLLNTAVGAGQAQSITIRAAGQTKSVTWQPESSINSVISEIMKESRNIQPPRPPSSSGGSSGSGGSSSGGFRSSGSSSRRSSSRSSGRSSSSRRSGGGGRRGFK